MPHERREYATAHNVGLQVLEILGLQGRPVMSLRLEFKAGDMVMLHIEELVGRREVLEVFTTVAGQQVTAQPGPAADGTAAAASSALHSGHQAQG